MPNLVIVKEGWLHKRGEHIKTWRPRYFILKSDGNFLGYNSKPSTLGEIDTPNNVFHIKECKVLLSDKPKLNVFTLKCISNEKHTIERVFATTNNQEREEWIKSIHNVSNLLNGNFIIEKFKEESLKITLHDFEFLKILGIGTFCKVILCRERFSKRLCAMKILKKSLIISRNEVVHAETENRVMRSIKHPFITSLIYSFQTTDRLCLVMEYVNGGELFFHLKRERKFNENKSRFYCAEICLALGFLHENNIIYRDLKLENILLDSEGHLKLADFGLCKTDMGFDCKTNTFCGTMEYLAPEIISMKNLKEDGYTRAVDWWACGILLYEMLIGRLPFIENSSSNDQLYNKILYSQVYFPCDLSQESRLILSNFLEKDPQKRLGSGPNGFDEIKKHSFFNQIDWKKLYNKEVEPPFKPLVNSDIDTCYFETEFTGENVQLTPPDAKTRLELTNEINYFDKFSYYGSKSSLNSRKSHISMGMASERIVNQNTLDKFDTLSLAILNHDASSLTHTVNISKTCSSEYLPSPHTPNSLKRSNFSSQSESSQHEEEYQLHNDISSIYLASNAFPNMIQFTDDNGQSFQSKTYFNHEINNSNYFECKRDSNNAPDSSSSSMLINKIKQVELPKINLNYKYLSNNYETDFRQTFDFHMNE